MVSLFNVIWFIVIGWWSAGIWLVLSAIFALTIVGIPIAKACLQFAKLNAFPYGKDIVRETELRGQDDVSKIRQVGGVIVNAIWFPIGLILAVLFVVEAILCFITIIGIPVGVVMVRMAKFVVFPVGAKVVSTKQAYASATANEIDRRNRKRSSLRT